MPRATRARRAMTLLELLVALALLGAMTTLVAAMWAQVAQWNDTIARGAEILRPQRVHTLLDDQWAERRAAVSLSADNESALETRPDGFAFLTASPALHPDAPLVVARYRLEPADPMDPDGDRRLVYEERAVKGTASAVESDLDQPPASVTLLPRCRALDLRWLAVPPEPPRLRADSDDAAPQREARPQPMWFDADAASDPDNFATFHAVRIAGVVDGERFEWTGVVQASR